MSSLDGLVVIEPVSEYTKQILRLKRVYAAEKTPYQEIVFAELEGFGRALLIDRFVQSTERDEHIYHELLVHPALALHPEPRRGLIVGGGEGATLREVLKHNTIEEAVMVDIDEKVVEFSKKYLEVMHKGSFYDPRAKTIIMDGLEYVRRAPSSYFDAVIMDLTDPYAGPTALPLYSLEAFQEIKRILRPNGVLATQAGSSYFYPKEYREVKENIEKNFRYLAEYWTWIPSFATNVNFIVASDAYDLYSLSAETFDERLRARKVTTRYLSGRRLTAHLNMGVLYG
ncbi:MAG: methyltransferase domain-containing protein [Thermofilum sp.]|nr:methyltransferase domain-containing protein [Thermofilum sp.]